MFSKHFESVLKSLTCRVVKRTLFDINIKIHFVWCLFAWLFS
jgi:hypothetical protein